MSRVSGVSGTCMLTTSRFGQQLVQAGDLASIPQGELVFDVVVTDLHPQTLGVQVATHTAFKIMRLDKYQLFMTCILATLV